jgi:two-component system phosphate regulon sensor histidine kinase PhoR
MRAHAGRLLPGLLGSALAALVAGLLVDAAAGWAVLAACFAWLLGRQYANLLALHRWASRTRLTDPPESHGLWGEAFDYLYRHRRATLRRRRELAKLIVRSRRAAEALPYGVALLDGENRLDWCNAAAGEHFGIAAPRDSGAPIQNFVRHPAFAAYLAAGDFDSRVVLRVGGAIERSLSVQLLVVDESGRLLISSDITGTERVEAMRRDFVANASHELRTPLTVLSGFLETIRDLNLDAGRCWNVSMPRLARSAGAVTGSRWKWKVRTTSRERRPRSPARS